MGAVNATLKDVKIVESHNNLGPSGTTKRLAVTLYVTNGATQVAGGTDTLDVDFASLLDLRDGATYTLRDWMVIQCAESSSTEYAATGTVSSSKISLTPVTPAAWSSNATIAASALVKPYGILGIVDVT